MTQLLADMLPAAMVGLFIAMPKVETKVMPCLPVAHQR